MAVPYPISAGILPALPEYHCHCSPRHHGQVSHVTLSKVAPAPRKPPLWMHPDLRRGEERPRLAKTHIHPTSPNRRIRPSSATHPPRWCVEGSTARARTELESAPECASTRNAGTPTSDRNGLSRSAPRRHPPGVTRPRCRQATDTLARVLPGLRPSSR